MITQLQSKPIFGTQSNPLVVIVGETASGKSSLAMQIAKQFDGEIICADSRTVYRGLSIGVAKPTKREQREIPHHMLDVVQPNQSFTVADFQKGANFAIASIRRRNKLPILVGGTGLYIDAVIFNYQFRNKYNKKIQSILNGKTISELQSIALSVGYTTKDIISNRRQLTRLIAAGPTTHEDRKNMIPGIIIVGLRINRNELRRRIQHRVELMFNAGLRKEVEELHKHYGWEHEALTGIGYREFEPYYRKAATMGDVKRAIVQHTLQYAKRQRTWFKRNPAITWFDNAMDAFAYIETKLTVY